MPHRMARKVLDHIYEHPRRLIFSSICVLVLSLGLAVYSLHHSFDTAHQGRVENCRAVNELSRKIYITAADLGVALADRVKFLPMQDCESLP